MASLISEAHAQCYFAFEDLIEAIKNPKRDFRHQMTLSQVEEEFDKYKLWAGNVGAANSGKRYQISLDYRLREASFYKSQVLKLLDTLDKTIQNGLSLLRNERQPYDELVSVEKVDSSLGISTDDSPKSQQEADDSPWEISSESTDEDQPSSDFTKEPAIPVSASSSSPLHIKGSKHLLEISRIFESIKFTIICLYKMPIRQPAPFDRLKHKISIEASFYQPFDILYVSDKFPQLDSEVATRLGKLISRRRQILRYRESHDQSLDTANVKPKLASASRTASKAVPESKVNSSPEDSKDHTGLSQAASSHFTLHSKATTLKEGDTELDKDALYAHSLPESRISMASSYTGNDLKVAVPPRPKDDEGKEMDRFECPYCFVTKIITSDQKWKKHVLEDLRPYVCTYRDCELFDHFFENRDEWYKHEKQNHRVKWFCNTANHPEYENESAFLEHMKHIHNVQLKQSQLPSLKDMFLHPSRANAGQCNLCMRESTNLRSHISRHLQQMALFALPRVNETAGSGEAEMNSRSAGESKQYEEPKNSSRHLDSSSQSSARSLLETQESSRANVEHELSDDLEVHDKIEEIDVPDAILDWDQITDKFSKARENNIIPTYQSPLRHRRRLTTRISRIAIETLNAKSEYVINNEQDGKAEHRVNQYTIKDEIGRGSFGAVHLAIDQYGTEFAVKEFSKARLRKRAQSNILRKTRNQRRFDTREELKRSNISLLTEENESSLYLVKEELSIMKKLDHPNLVSLIEVLDDPEEDSLYMVIELCKKGVVMKVGLGEKAEPYDMETCWCWFRDLILAVEYLHSQGVVHRDIKPDNLLLTEDDVLKLSDFGVAEMFENDNAAEMRTAKSAGSPAFLPPELCVPKHGEISGKAADIWSMGATLYCLKFGQIPFERSGVLELYEAIKTEELNLGPDLNRHPDFVDLMTKIFEKDPDKRIKMEELREHPWVTRDGFDPLMSVEENTGQLVEPPTETEVNHAITADMSHNPSVMKAARQFIKLLDKNPKKSI